MLRRLFTKFATQGRIDQQGRINLDIMLDKMDSKLETLEQIIRPSAVAKPRTSFMSHIPPDKMFMMNLTPRQILKILPTMVPLQYQIRRSAHFYDQTQQPTRSEATPQFLADLEALAHRAGASAVRYVRVPRHAIFQHKGIPCEYAIVFTVEMEKDPIDTSPSFEAMHEVMRGYKQLAVISNKLARLMRRHGYAAYPGTALGGLTDYPHLAELAGLGAIGYHGLLITPDNGARLRLNTIYTNITNLPLEQENEHLWIRDFCALCHKCIRRCPPRAIFDQPQPRGDGGMQCIDHDACRDYFAIHHGCGICLAVCPFSQVGYDKVQERFKGNESAPQFRIPVPMAE